MQIKSLILLLIAHFSNSAVAQISEWKKCGLDDAPLLSKVESEYFNEVFSDRKINCDFTKKTVAFFTGTSGNTKSTKSSYFNRLKPPNQAQGQSIHKWLAGGTQVLILTEKEKRDASGYDIIMISWSKFLKQGKSRTRLIRKLKNKNK